MIEFKKGNILADQAEAIVNTVNCVGVMGKGIALQFKQAYPENFKAYKKACDNNEVQPGQMFVYHLNSMFNPKYVINFPTKRDWRQKSLIDDIDSGLKDLARVITQYNIKSIAIPPLGCGNGGLNWSIVKEKIIKSVENLENVTISLFEPAGAPASIAMPVKTEPPKMTIARALYLLLMERYTQAEYLLSQLEIQKLAYFLQTAGENLRLNFVAHKYGPYADNLNHVLLAMEGHFIRGYGDRSAGQATKQSIRLQPAAIAAAKEFVADNTEALEKLNRVADLITGFETPYGLELLATTHWVIKTDPAIKNNGDEIIAKVQNWSTRKKELFTPAHIKKAAGRLIERNWV